MKILRTSLYVFSYICQYIMPIILFGIVVPYYRGAAGTGLTGAGILALCLVLSTVYKKIEKKINENITGVWHGALLSIFPIVVWVALGIGIQKIINFVNTLVEYWWLSFVFIIIGRVLSIIADGMAERGTDGQ